MKSTAHLGSEEKKTVLYASGGMVGMMVAVPTPQLGMATRPAGRQARQNDSSK
jgi:hypothetical protein